MTTPFDDPMNFTAPAGLAEELNLPTPPASPIAGSTAEDGSLSTPTAGVNTDIMDSLPDGPEPLPKGIYHMRLESYKKSEKNGQPNFNITLTCQQEPEVGRKSFDTIPWVSEQTIADATDPSSPNNPSARRLLKDRLWKINQFRKACNYAAQGTFNPETFFSTNPECRVDLEVEERKSKDEKGDYTVSTGTFGNKVKKYLPLT